MRAECVVSIVTCANINPFYPEAVADELQPVHDQIQEISLTASEIDRPSIKMDITLLFLIKFLNMISAVSPAFVKGLEEMRVSDSN